MHITLVKKIKSDGATCNKCEEVERRLKQRGYIDRIDYMAIADERDPDSEGMQLARRHQVELAPFFIVELDDGSTQIYTVYFRFIKEILENPSLDYQEAV